MRYNEFSNTLLNNFVIINLSFLYFFNLTFCFYFYCIWIVEEPTKKAKFCLTEKPTIIHLKVAFKFKFETAASYPKEKKLCSSLVLSFVAKQVKACVLHSFVEVLIQ